VTYNTYLEVLGKSGSWQQAEDVFRDMQKRGILPAVNTFTIMINIYGKVSHIPTTHSLPHFRPNVAVVSNLPVFVNQAYYPDKAERLFQSMRKALCPPSLYTYTALINAHAREGNCVRAEEIFAELQSAGFVPDVYTYNALLEAYRFVDPYSTMI
jgi:pentatricopeptide repeat protein